MPHLCRLPQRPLTWHITPKSPWSLCRQPGGHPQPPAATSQSSRISSRSTTLPPGLSTRLRASTPQATPPGSKAAAAASVGLPSDMGGAAGTISYRKHHPRQAGGLGGGPFRPPSVPIRTSSGDRSAGYTGSDEGGAAKQLHPRRSRRALQRKEVKEAVGQGWRFAKQILPWSLTSFQVRAFPGGSCFRSQRGKCEGGTPSLNP